MKKLQNKKGFTMAELLIVVAIIAVLVAISIPIFSERLESAREATDLSNIRNAYAQAATDQLDGTTSTYTVNINQKKNGWKGSNANAVIGGSSVNDGSLAKLGETYNKVTVGVDANGSLNCTFASE